MEDVTRVTKKVSVQKKNPEETQKVNVFTQIKLLTEKEIIKICLRSEDIKRKKVLYRWNCMVED